MALSSYAPLMNANTLSLGGIALLDKAEKDFGFDLKRF
jgi:hypothetical protein